MPVAQPAAATLIGVGVGPGDPGNVTLAAIDAIRNADRVAAPSASAEAVGRAESVVRQVCPEVFVDRLVIPMVRPVPGPETGSEHPDPFAPAASRIAGWLDGGESVAFVTIGDPHVYSTFSSLVDSLEEVRPGTPVRTVSGIMAFQSLAVAAGMVVLDGTENLALVTALDDLSSVRQALDRAEQAVVVYKGGRRFPEIAKIAADAGRLEGAVAGELLGLPGERVVPLSEISTESAYLSTIIFPPRRGAPPR